MTDSTLTAEIVTIVRKVAKLDASVPVSPEARLIEDLGIDSLDLVGVFLQIQDELNVAIDEEDVTKLATIRDLAEYVGRNRSSAAA